jgi:predicted NBD/HSP70 family sugar kinase
MIVRRLQEMGLVREIGAGLSSGGRKPLNLEFVHDARLMYVLDFWDQKKVYLIDMKGNIHGESSALPCSIYCTPAEFAKLVMKGVEQIASRIQVDEDRLLGLGLCMPGIVDYHRKEIIYSAELGWRHVNVENLFKKEFPEKIFIERIGNLMALGLCDRDEFAPCDNFMLVVVSTSGIGASLLQNGVCLHGDNNMVGEIGHSILNSEIACSCGHKGCLEAIVKARIMDNSGKIDIGTMNQVAMIVSGAINLMDVSTIALTGDLVTSLDDRERETMLKMITSQVFSAEERKLNISIIGHSNHTAVVGMGTHIFQEYFGM